MANSGEREKPRKFAVTCRGKGIFLLALVLVLVFDLWSKSASFAIELPCVPRPPVLWVFGNWFGLTQTLNPGAVWGIGSGFSGALVLVRILVFLGVLVYLLLMEPGRRVAVLALGLISGGALGNLYDNFTHRAGGFTWNLGDLFSRPGMVRDFLHVDFGFWPCNPWPDFNVADSMILIGVGLLVIFLPPPTKCGKAESEEKQEIAASPVEDPIQES